jgi:hypothetical protein
MYMYQNVIQNIFTGKKGRFSMEQTEDSEKSMRFLDKRVEAII